MKKLLLLLLFPINAWASCPLYTYPENSKLNQEIQNTCSQILNPTINYATISSATITTLTASKLILSSGYSFQPPVEFISSNNSATTSSTFQDTPLTATITPTSSSNRIKITVNGTIGVDDSGTQNRITLKRGSTNLGGSAGLLIFNSSGGTLVTGASFTFIDSPAATTATVYTVQMASSNNVSTVEWQPSTNSKAVMTLEEIK